MHLGHRSAWDGTGIKSVVQNMIIAQGKCCAQDGDEISKVIDATKAAPAAHCPSECSNLPVV